LDVGVGSKSLTSNQQPLELILVFITITLLTKTSTKSSRDKMQSLISPVSWSPSVPAFPGRGGVVLLISCLHLISTSSLGVVNAVPIQPSPEIRPPSSSPVENVVTWSKNDPDPYSPPVDNTLLIVGPIAGGIILMVFVFFIYIFSEKNVTDEGFDYQDLSTPEDADADAEPGPSPDAPSTSSAAFHL